MLQQPRVIRQDHCPGARATAIHVSGGVKKPGIVPAVMTALLQKSPNGLVQDFVALASGLYAAEESLFES